MPRILRELHQASPISEIIVMTYYNGVPMRLLDLVREGT